jgi:hypothetical protein
MLIFTSYLVLFSIYYAAIIAPGRTNYQKVFDEFEVQLPMPAVTKSFQSYTCPPWIVSDNQADTKEKFLAIAYGGDLFAIYKEQDYWGSGMIYYVAVSPKEYSDFIMVFRYCPEVIEIDNGFFKPKTYEIV